MVIGAGPGGCAAAYDLAAAGRDILLIDRAEFPRQKACAGGITLTAIRSLRYSVRPIIERAFRDVRLELHLHRGRIVRKRTDHCFMTVRETFDHYCFTKTLERGAQFRRIRMLESVRQSANVVEIQLDGEALYTRFVIGADGVHSRVRTLTEPPNGWFWRGFALEARIPCNTVERYELTFDLSPIRKGYGWVFPKGDHLNVGLYSYAKDEKIDRERLGRYIKSRNFQSVPMQVVGQYTGFGASRHIVGNTRVFLVGDAGGFVNPFTGEGISQAIRSGQAAAAAIDMDLKGLGPANLWFRDNSKRLRRDLAVASMVGHWFYGNLKWGYLCFSTPGVSGSIAKFE
nr:geranylgeranyl reductase family protein [Edaphobacter aggregans]